MNIYSILNYIPYYEYVWAGGGIAPRILNLGSRLVSFTPRPLYPQGKILRYPLVRKLSGPQSWSGRGSEEKNSDALP